LAQLRNSEKISRWGILAAQALGARINNAVRDREAVVGSSEVIDPDFAMPVANWDSPANHHLKNYRLLASLEPEEIRGVALPLAKFHWK